MKRKIHIYLARRCSQKKEEEKKKEKKKKENSYIFLKDNEIVRILTLLNKNEILSGPIFQKKNKPGKSFLTLLQYI